MKTKDLTGQRFGRLVARKRLPSLKPGDGFRWECDCDCGGHAVVKSRLLTYKNGTRSCGCLLLEANRARPERRSTNVRHGHTSRKVSPEYICWSSMIQRCTNPNHASYKNYGGRGVTVCQEWLESFERFLADMGPRLEKNSIDRIDPERGYDKGNCRWATHAEQGSNRRNNRMATAFGKRHSCAEAAALYDIPYSTIRRWAEQTGGDISERITAHGLKAKPAASVG